MLHTIQIDNAVIMAAGFSSRFQPLSLKAPKCLWPVKGEILIERQIRQLKKSGIHDIYIVTGYKREQFDYLRDKFQVQLIENSDYQTRNNHSSIWAARNVLANTYICSSDNYFPQNVFRKHDAGPYYSALYSVGSTDEYCLSTDANGRIRDVTIGGSNAWYMLGHVLFDEEFSGQFLRILSDEYPLEITMPKLWEQIYMEHLDELALYIRKFPPNQILEFDSVQELAQFDSSYRDLSKYL